MSSNTIPHKLGRNATREFALSLYSHPESVIKEAITNGLDQQAGKPNKEKRIDITTHVGPDDDLWIEDPGTGIEDLDKFVYIGEGYKTVGDRVSSYTKIDEEIGGNKGFGKFGFLMLAGGEKPTVEFYSHRPTVEGTYKAQGIKVTMDFDGFRAEYMDTTEALLHPGVRVVIKHCKWELLPKETAFIKYISKMFAIRISRGTKIFLDGTKISAPEGFDSREFPLFDLDDGSVVMGNFWANDKAENKNVWAFNKNIFVEDFYEENKASGWFNDNYIVPTTSRESIKQNTRWQKIREKLKIYLDEYYPVPVYRELGKMGKEKDKNELLIQMLQFRDHLLSGIYDKTGIIGEVTGGQAQEKKLVKKQNVTLTKTGNPDDVLVIPIGPGTRPHPRHRGNGPGYEEEGDHDILTKEGDTNKIKQGPIRPQIRQIALPLGEKREMAFFTENGMCLNWNTYWPQTQKAYGATGTDWKFLVAPVYAQAMTNLDRETIDPEMDLVGWQQRYAMYMKFAVDKK
jgi:hypothetical protein